MSSKSPWPGKLQQLRKTYEKCNLVQVTKSPRNPSIFICMIEMFLRDQINNKDDSNNHCGSQSPGGPSMSPSYPVSVLLCQEGWPWQIEYGDGEGDGMSFLRLGDKVLCLASSWSLSFPRVSQLPYCVQLYGEAHMVRQHESAWK